MTVEYIFMKRFLIAILLCGCMLQAMSQSVKKSDMEDKKMEWWKDAKFGMFIHWGVYSVPAGVYKGKKIEGIGEWIMNTAKIPVKEYKQYAKQFNPDHYDPEAWVKMAKNAGMKYIIITSKHHDGFAMFDSKVTDWNIKDASPYGKDVLGPLVAACRKEGIRIGFYYSQAQDWNHPGGAVSGGAWDDAQKGDFDAYLDTIAVPQVKEILTKYGEPDILWWDTPQNMTPARAAKFAAVLENHPNLITNNRLGGGYNGDTETPEQFVPSTGFPGRNWEACMTMNDTWGYKSTDENWKSTKTLVRNLADVVSKGGNFLLNVGPNAHGEIPNASIKRLAEIGKWIRVNHEAIYGTTASPFPYLSWGRCTRKGQKLYLHVFNYPVDGELRLPMINKISRAYLLASPGKLLKVKTENERSQIVLPKQMPDTLNTVVVVEFAGEPKVAASPVKGKNIESSSQMEGSPAKNLLDGNRLTGWKAAKGERSAILNIDMEQPIAISTLIVLQYKDGDDWKVITEITTGGVGGTKDFKSIKARYFRLMIDNKDTEPELLEWQLYGPE
jgi:alpha-L-fucosidase